jgi:hypothetical protein
MYSYVIITHLTQHQHHPHMPTPAHEAPHSPWAAKEARAKAQRLPSRSTPRPRACTCMYDVQHSVPLPVVTRFSPLANRWPSTRTTTGRRRPSTSRRSWKPRRMLSRKRNGLMSTLCHQFKVNGCAACISEEVLFWVCAVAVRLAGCRRQAFLVELSHIIILRSFTRRRVAQT